MTERIEFTLTTMEVTGLTDLLSQLTALLDDPVESDPALRRLSPDAYPDDEAASREFRRLTEGDLLTRRRQDAATVSASLPEIATLSTEAADDVVLTLGPEEVRAWMRTLTAMRLVIATRLGIGDGRSEEDSHDDPAYGIYDWLAYRLESLMELSTN